MIKKIFFLKLLLLLNFTIVLCQDIDKIVNKQIYTSYYSTKLKAPLYVEYELYNGGGNVSRKNMRFIEEDKTAKNKDYSRSGYDRGHLVSAEDFAYSSELEKLTFSYFNVFPQHPKLNRGSWKSWEHKIREESKKNPLKIYVGGIYGSKTIKNKIAIPDYCWKVVYNKKSQRLLHVLLFKNDSTQMVIRTTLESLRKQLNYNVNFYSK